MSSPHLNAALPPPGLPARPEEQLSHELTSLVEDIQRTKDWFNIQMDAQLSSLMQLRATMLGDNSQASPLIATLFKAPRPVVTAAPVIVEAPPGPPTVSFQTKAIILPPTEQAMIAPELEQTTLHELNNALALAFSEISSRGGMLG